jgi:hypothetical protein
MRLVTLVQIFLPLYRPDGELQPEALFAEVRKELTKTFGGITAYTRAPAEGLWTKPSGRTAKDDLVVHEVLCDRLDPTWWSAYRSRLEERFAQREVLVRAQRVRLL